MNYEDVKELFTKDIDELIKLIRNKTLLEILDKIKIEFYGVHPDRMYDTFSRDEIVSIITEIIQAAKEL